MKLRILSTLVIVLAISFSVALASENGGKTAKEAPKKEQKAPAEKKSMKGCCDKDMMDCGAKEAKLSKKSADVKTEKKADEKPGEGK